MALCSNVQSQTLLFCTVSGIPAWKIVLPAMCEGQETVSAIQPPWIVLFWIDAPGDGAWMPLLFWASVLLEMVRLPLPAHEKLLPIAVPFRLKLLFVTTPTLMNTPHWLLSLNTLSLTMADPNGNCEASTPMLLETTRICSTRRPSPPRIAV